jgi:hypothetical protein
VRPQTTAPGERRWLLLRTFFSSWKRFLLLFEEYERRVKEFSVRYKTERSELRLSPDDLVTLIDFKALEDLRDREVSILRETSHDLFRSPDATDRLDNLVSIIYHELSALKEEHYTLREQFVREEEIEYDLFYREVNEYYPKRLRHIRNLYEKAERRLRELLPSMAEDRIVVRSLYLFGPGLVRGVLPGGVDDVYAAMYPDGTVEAMKAAGDSFRDSGFRDEAAEAYGRAAASRDADAPGRGRAAKRRAKIVQEAAAALEALRADSGPERSGAPSTG